MNYQNLIAELSDYLILDRELLLKCFPSV